MDKEKEIEGIKTIILQCVSLEPTQYSTVEYQERFNGMGLQIDSEKFFSMLQKEGYRKADEMRKETVKEILSGLVHWLKGAIRDSYDHAVKEQFGIYGGKNHAFHEMLDLIKKIAEKEGIELDK